MGGASARMLESRRDVAAAATEARLSPFSYVLPWRAAEPAAAEAVDYLRQVAAWGAEVIVVDGSPPAVFAANARAWGAFTLHVPPDARHLCLMGKVAGVLSGIDRARCERVVIADDDVRWGRDELARVLELLDECDLVRPQNYFSPAPWHALWDTARTLLNRSLAADFPGTLAVRRSSVVAAGGYDGNVMFENLELIRTIAAAGGRVSSPLDLYVRRLPPSTGHFWGQRTRQAYDDFAIPGRMAVWLAVLPGLGAAAACRRLGVVAGGGALACVTLAEVGRRRAGGTRVFAVWSSLLAPGWVLERGVCAWLAVYQRLRFGGVRYGDSVIRVAAHSERQLRRRGRQAGPASRARSAAPASDPR